MTDPDQYDRLIRRRLAAYSREASGDVLAPGAQDVYRAVKHRQRRRTTVLAVAGVCLLMVLLGNVYLQHRNALGPATVPPSPSLPTQSQSPPGASASVSPTPSHSPSPSPSRNTPSPTRSSSGSPPSDPGPARRTYPVVDGSELHVVALDRVTLRPVGDHYEGVVYVDVYNSGRQTEEYNDVYLTTPAGVQEQPGGPLEIGGCGIPSPPETWVCNAKAVSAMGGRVRVWFTVTVDIAPGGSSRTVPGFAVRFVAVGQQNKVLTDVTPADNRAEVTLVLPPV
jgi:hypothetical protein